MNLFIWISYVYAIFLNICVSPNVTKNRDADPFSGHVDPPSRMMVQRTLMTDNFTVFFLNFHLFYADVPIKKVMTTLALCRVVENMKN
jgi:hypothetical protein